MSTGPSDLGYSPDHPVTVGGGRIFAGFNQRRYLTRLRGPAGGPLEFERVGSVQAGHILDIYAVRSPGLAEPVHLLLDAYAPGPNGIPNGFTLDDPGVPWELARSIVPADGSPPARPDDGPGKWEMIGQDGDVYGYVDWNGDGVTIDMPKHTGALLRERVEPLLASAPAAYKRAVLADLLERVIAWDSRGMIRGRPVSRRVEPEWSGQVWKGESREREGRRRRGFFRRNG